jgi:hypothetical protein
MQMLLCQLEKQKQSQQQSLMWLRDSPLKSLALSF